MSGFNQSRAYKPEGNSWAGDTRHLELLHHIYSHRSLSTLHNSPTNILTAIDEFGRTQKYLMNVGEDKGRIVADLIELHRPKLMVELGGYIGYSAILFGDALRRAGGHRYYSLERNPEFAAVIGSLVDLAGLSDVVKVIVGPSDVSIAQLHAEGKLDEGIDMMFLDHYKPAYTTDLKLCEELGVIRPGRTVLAADNVIKPGNPPYLEYVRSSVNEKKAAVGKQDGGAVHERFKDRTTKEYGDVEVLGKAVGDPRLIYESKIQMSWEPTGEEDGVEITRCVGRAEN